MTPNETEEITKELEEEEAREMEEVMKETGLAETIEKFRSVPPRGGRPLTPKEKEEITKQLKEWEARWMEEVTKEKDEAKKEKGVANKEKDGFT